jgi:hypothetical protein
MSKRTILTGGGYKSVQHKDMRAGWKTEPKPKAIDPASVSTLGMSTQFKKPDLVSGPGYRTGPQQSTGIGNARKGPAGAGPGGMGRTIYKSGSQSPTPPAREIPKGRDTLAEFGPEISGPGRRR